MEKDFLQELTFYQSNPKLYLNKFYDYIYANLPYFKNVDENLAEMLTYAKNNNDNLLLSLYYYTKYLTRYNADLDNAFPDLKKSLEILENEENCKKYNLYFAIVLSLTICYSQYNQIEKALRLTIDAIKYLSKTNNINSLIQFNINLSYILAEMNLKKEALDTISSFDPNFKYLHIQTRRHLLTALICHSLALDLPHKVIEYIKLLENDPKYQSGYYKSLLDCYYMIYYCKLDKLDMADLYFEKIKEVYGDIREFINLPGPANRTTLFISIARYLYKKNDLKKSFDFYQYIIEHISSYIGERISILDEAIELAFKLNKIDEVKNYFELLRKYSKNNNQILYNSFVVNNTITRQDISPSSVGYNRIMQHMNIVNAFFSDMFKANNLQEIQTNILTLTKRFNENAHARLLFIIGRRLCYFDKFNKPVKVLGFFDYKKYGSNFMQNIPLNLKIIFKDCDYLTPLISNNEIVGFFLYDKTLFDSFDDASIPLGKEAINATSDAIYKLNRYEKIGVRVLQDELTKANNRYALSRFVDDYDFEKPLYFVEIDIDDFKIVNDTYGHPCGDYVLQTIVKKLQKLFNKDDVYRVGGEEFVVLTKDDKEMVSKKFLTFEEELKSKPFKYHDNEFIITVSYGGTRLDNKKQFDQAYRKADQLLYEIKKDTKGNGIIK